MVINSLINKISNLFKISDLHISIFHNKDIVKDLEYFIKNVLAVVKPKVVIATGG